MATTTRNRTRSTKANNGATPEPDPTPPVANVPTIPAPIIPVAPYEPGAAPPIHVLVAQILAEMPAIGKNRENTQQNFKFRGIDDVLDALNPIMSKYWVVCMPHEVIDVSHDARVSKGGNPVYATYVTMKYRWYGPNGDWIETVGIGEGTDSLDKSTPKAMTGAYKYMLFEGLAIATREVASLEPDHGPAPETVHPTLGALITRHEALPDDLRDKVRLQIQDKVWNGARVAMTATPEGWWPLYESMVALGEKRVAERIAAAQDADATAPQDVPNQPPAASPPPDATPEPTPVTGPVVDTPPDPPQPAPTPEPATEPATAPDTAPQPATDEPTDNADDGEEVVTWEMVEAMDRDEVKRRLDALGAMPDNKRTPTDTLKEQYWLAIGGKFDDDPPDNAEEFQCPECDTFSFQTEEELNAHMTDAHGSAADAGATPTPSESAPPPAAAEQLGETIDEATLAVVRELLSSLKGASARSYAEYRRGQSLPPSPDKLTMSQAYALVDFLEQLPS